MQTKRKRDPMLSMRCYEHGWDPAEDINVDEDGQITSASLTYEASGTSIEVLIELDTPPAEAAKFLRKMADWVEELMAPASIEQLKDALQRGREIDRDRRNRAALEDAAN